MKRLLTHAVLGLNIPITFHNSPLLIFKGNQHDCYNYVWDRQQVAKLTPVQLADLYGRLSISDANTDF